MEPLREIEGVWISLVEVEACTGQSDFKRGEKAFVNGLALAVSAKQAELRLRAALRDLHFHAVSMEGTELLSKRLSEFEVEPNLVALAVVAHQVGVPQFGDFFVWENQG